MADAARCEAWQHTSVLLATLANIHRDPKKKPKPYTAEEFHPLLNGKRATPIQSAEIHDLKKVFVKQ